MTHRRITCWQDLAEYGIEVLTGEACLIGARYLCDLNDRGARIVRAMLGLPPDCKLAENWNSSGRIGPHVASIKLPTDLFDQLAVFCLFDAGCKHVIVTRRHGIYGVTEPRLDAEGGAWQAVEEFRATYGDDAVERTYTPIGHPGVGLDATHAMSGRTT
jgi:hypothetical protein